MTRKPIHQQIFLGVESIVALRVLLFIIPVLLYKFQAQSPLAGPRDWFVLGVGICAAAFFLVGILSLIGFARWRLLQYIAVALTVALTAVFYLKIAPGPDLMLQHLIPGGVSVAVLAYLLATRNQ